MPVDGGDKMNDVAVVALSPETVLGEMKKNGVTHVVWLPDSETNWLYLLIGGFAARLALGPQHPGRADGRLSRLDAPRRQSGHRCHLYRAVFDGVWDQLLPRRERRRCAAHLDRLRGGRTHQ